MKLGICTAFENADQVAAAGYDYLECNLSQLAAMEDAAFEALMEQAKTFRVPVLACNGFLPGKLKVTGPDRDINALREYMDKALCRASAIGIRTAVFGSGDARNVPAGWPFAKAWKQLKEFLTAASEYAEKYNVKIAIEPLRRQECNIVNLVSEAMVLAAWVDSPYVGVLADTFHMISSQEPWTAMADAGDKLMHVHISSPLPDLSGRIYPAPNDGNEYGEIFAVLEKMGYQGGISVEAGTGDLARDAAACMECIGRYRNDVYR